MGMFDTPQATYSTQFKQKSRFGKDGYELTLTLNGTFEYLPRLRRSPNSDSWQPLFLCLTPNGIEDGAYSTISIFTASDDSKSWNNIVEFEGWNAGGYGEKKGKIHSIEFVQKDGTILRMDDKHANHGSRQVPSIRQRCTVNVSNHLSIDPKNPVVEIIITSKEYAKAQEAKPLPLKPYILQSEYEALSEDAQIKYKALGGVKYLECHSNMVWAVTGDPSGEHHNMFVGHGRQTTVIWTLPEIVIEKSFTDGLSMENMWYMSERPEYNFMPEYAKFHRDAIINSNAVNQAVTILAIEKELSELNGSPVVAFPQPEKYAMSVINSIAPRLLQEDKDKIAIDVVSKISGKPAAAKKVKRAKAVLEKK